MLAFNLLLGGLRKLKQYKATGELSPVLKLHSDSLSLVPLHQSRNGYKTFYIKEFLVPKTDYYIIEASYDDYAYFYIDNKKIVFGTEIKLEAGLSTIYIELGDNFSGSDNSTCFSVFIKDKNNNIILDSLSNKDWLGSWYPFVYEEKIVSNVEYLQIMGAK